MTYAVKEIYYTLQGEGANVGRPAVFLRFSGCNLWTGRLDDRASAICRFCDTDFVGTDGPLGGKYRTPSELADVVTAQWPNSEGLPERRFVVCTGGEPLLQLDTALIDALHEREFEIAIETNGSVAAPEGLDWICMSPKIGAELVQKSGSELKLVYPQDGGEPDQFVELDFTHFFLQPMDGPDLQRNTQMAIQYCLTHPFWRLSLQSHKLLGIP